MFLDDQLYQAYLEEMEQLEHFRSSHSTLYRDTPIELLEDPDTLRLVESLAFFSAKNRTQGLHCISQLHQILFRQYFSFLIAPLPSMGMVQFHPSLRVPDRVDLKEQTELIAHTYDERKASFQSLVPISVLPLFFDSFNFFQKIQGGWHLEISFKAPYLQSEGLEKFSFYINHLNSFWGSLRTFFAFHRSLESINVFYDEKEIKKIEGYSCKWTFGDKDDLIFFNHPLSRIRSKLHFPEQSLYLTIQIPPQKKKWEVITFSFELNDLWPKQLTLTKTSLVPFVTPVVNLKSCQAEPIECDGTKDSYHILHPNPNYQFFLHSISGVYEVSPIGMKPLKPGILDKRGRTYEIDYLEHRIFLDLPGAFQNPCKVSIDAFWTQLWFSDYIDQEFKLSLAEKQLPNLQLNLLNQMINNEVPNTVRDPKFLLRILSLKNQNQLNINEILFLMNGLKNIDHSYFHFVPSLIKELKINQQVDRAGIGPTIQYEFRLKEWDGKNWELVVFFFHQVHLFLNSWLSNFHVETILFFPQIKKPLHFKGGSENELSLLARDFFLP